MPTIVDLFQEIQSKEFEDKFKGIDDMEILLETISLDSRIRSMLKHWSSDMDTEVLAAIERMATAEYAPHEGSENHQHENGVIALLWVLENRDSESRERAAELAGGMTHTEDIATMIDDHMNIRKQYRVEVSWRMYGTIYVTATDSDEAALIARDEDYPEGEPSDDGFEIDNVEEDDNY